MRAMLLCMIITLTRMLLMKITCDHIAFFKLKKLFTSLLKSDLFPSYR